MMCRSPLTALLTLLLLAVPSFTAQLGSESYVVPLIDGYFISARWVESPDGAATGFREYELSKLEEEYRLTYNTAMNSWGHDVIVYELLSFAVRKTTIIGEAKAGLFILDTLASANSQVKYFDTRDQWEAALEELSIPKDTPLQHPDDVARRLPDRVVYPWRYELFGGALGLSDMTWENVIPAIGLAVSIAMGLMCRSASIVRVAAVVIGVVVGAQQWLITSDQPPMGCGLVVVFPLVYLGVGRLVQLLAMGRREARRTVRAEEENGSGVVS